MDAASTDPESFSVLQSAKEGFKAIKIKPMRLFAMAAAVNIPHLLYALFVRTVLLPGQSMWGTGMAGYTSVPLLLRAENMVALLTLLFSLLLLRPIWIRLCLRLCSVESPRPNTKTYMNFAVANVLQFAVIFLIAAVMGLAMSLTQDLVQAMFIAAGVILISTVIVRFVFFPYLVVNLGYRSVQALKVSRKMTKGIFWQLFGWGALFMLCSGLLNSIPMGLGVILIDALFGTAVAMVYALRAKQLKLA
jgi:uncharacterized membrane protein